MVTPFSVWLPGLFNPTSYLTAVMQVTARRTGMPLDQMTTETHGTANYVLKLNITHDLRHP